MEVEKRDLKVFMEEQIRSKDVKVVESTVPFAENYIINDLSINQRGTDEDKAYAFNHRLRGDIRRGNSVVCKLDGTGSKVDYFWGRRGLQKFFDLQREYIEFNLNSISELTSFGIKNGAEHKELYRIIFGDAQQAIEEKDSVTIYKLVKANGENAQVSYFPELDAWVVSSKNVAIMARTLADIELYAEAKDRFSFARLIARSWFNLLEKLAKREGDAGIAALKKELAGHTMVGEYCGNQEYQHLVKYEEVDIHFYAIVDNDASESCIPPAKAYDIFKRYNMTTVTMTNEGSFNDFREFNTRLRDVYDEVASSDIEGEQEGSVLYFVRGDHSKPENQKTLSLSKLKTLEYRIFRKLREKLKNFIQRSDEKLYKKFEEETEVLCLNNAPAHPLEFYFEIGRMAFAFVRAHPTHASIVSEQYISFLSMLMHCKESGETPNPSLLEKDRLAALLAVPWSAYKSFSEKHDGKLAVVTASTASTESVARKGRNLTVLVPISIPGMGKSTLVKNLVKFAKEKHGDHIEVMVVSSDEVRRDLMEKLRRQKPHLKDQQLFEQTQKNASKEFFGELNAVLSTRSEKSKSSDVIVFIDKNHPPNSIENTINSIREKASRQFNLKICAVIPTETKADNYVIGTNIGYPFSLSFMIDCVQRVQTRKEHPTLTGNGKQSLDVMVMFLNLFRGASLSYGSLLASGIDDVVEYPFVKQDATRKFPGDLISKFDEVMSSTTPGQVCKIPGIVQSLSDKLKSIPIEFGFPSVEECNSMGLRVLQQCISPVGSSGYHHPVPASVVMVEPSRMEMERNDEEEEVKNNSDSSKKQNTVSTLKRKALKKFNPAKKPIYLGIFANDADFAKTEQKNYVKTNLRTLFEKFNDKVIESNLNELMNVFKFPASHHITTYFVKRQEGIFYENFEEGLNIPIESLAMVYVPNQIIAGVCFPDPNLIDVENVIPHITLFVGTLAPRFSNNVLQTLFVNQPSHEAPLGKLLGSPKLHDQTKEIYEKFTLPIPELPGKHDIYFIKPKNFKLVLPATTRAFFGNTNFHSK